MNQKSEVQKKDSKKSENKDSKKNNSKHEKIIKSKEENPMIDKLISEGVQNLLTFYQTKHKLVSQQVSKLGVLLYQFTSSQKKFDPEDLVLMENYANEFDSNYIKLMVVKNTYFKKMCELELFLHETEKDKKIVNLSDNTAKNGNKEKDKEKNNNNKNKNEEHNGTEKEMIDELIKLRQNYKKYLIRLAKYQKEYIDKINEISNEIQIFNIDENNLLYNLLKTFEENY